MDDNGCLLTHAGMPDAADDLASHVPSAMTASGLEIPDGRLAEEKSVLTASHDGCRLCFGLLGERGSSRQATFHDQSRAVRR